MTRLILTQLLLVVLVSTPADMAVAQETAASATDVDWVDLFDGKTLTGWTQRGGQANYSVVNGEIVGETVANTPNSFLCTDRDYSNFELQLEFQIHPELNSGVQIRSQSLPDYKNGQVHGYQIEIDPSDRAWTAGIYDEGRRGWLADLSRNQPARYAFKPGEWNQFRVVANGPRIQTWLNNVPAADLHDETTLQGFIALQVHGVGGRADPLQVRFRHIRLRELLAEPPEGNDPTTRAPAPGVIGLAPAGPIFARNTVLDKVVDGLSFAEGPAMGPDQALYFSDIPRNRIHRLQLDDLEKSVFSPDSRGSNGLAFAASGALLACEGGGRSISRWFADDRKVLIEKFEDKRLNSPNDLALDGVGGIYFTDPRYGDRSSMELDFEGVYYLDAQRKIKLLTRDLQRPNGIALSPDNQALYVADHAGSKLWRYDVIKPGELGAGRAIADMGSDGMTIDAYGRLLITWGKEVIALTSEGQLLDRIEFPEAPTNCELYGSWLLVTTPHAVYRVRTETKSALPSKNATVNVR